jgi:hypothetical protein
MKVGEEGQVGLWGGTCAALELSLFYISGDAWRSKYATLASSFC